MKLEKVINSELKGYFNDNLLQEILKVGILKEVSKEKIIVDTRTIINYIPLIINGIVKVTRRDGKGNPLLLHYLQSKEICAISESYASLSKESDIRLVATTDVSYILIPFKSSNEWSKKYKDWSDFKAKMIQNQFSFLINTINDVVFTSLEQRLAKYLKKLISIQNSTIIYTKHQEIARDLNVSREAISRALKKIEKEKLVKLGRNNIEIIDKKRL